MHRGAGAPRKHATATHKPSRGSCTSSAFRPPLVRPHMQAAASRLRMAHDDNDGGEMVAMFLSMLMAAAAAAGATQAHAPARPRTCLGRSRGRA